MKIFKLISIHIYFNKKKKTTHKIDLLTLSKKENKKKCV